MPCTLANLSTALFGSLPDYNSYLEQFPVHEVLGINLDDYGPVGSKIEKTVWESVDKNSKVPFVAELDDLIRLHHLAITRKVTTILEFGVGKSTLTFDLALAHNQEAYSPTSELRRANLHECHSVDDSKEWIKACKNLGLSERVFLHYSECRMATFEDRICTLYDSLPNICPDLIYLDGPDQFSPSGEINGISTRSTDRLPMSADILTFEHLLLPGTLIVVDGRTANARYIAANLQRNWLYWHSTDFDQHFFELVEAPLGEINSVQLEYCLGSEYQSRLSRWG